ncbi:MAG TPA: hypothetical protein VN843_13565 [Anaerolineales bacterium]|nr:hypothetical protein [Anaerolineales bacterium]
MGHSAGSGDRLARGAHSATYLTTEQKISQEAWDRMFNDFDPEKFQASAPTDPNAIKASSSGGFAEPESEPEVAQES